MPKTPHLITSLGSCRLVPCSCNIEDPDSHNLSTHSVLFDLMVYNCGRVITSNPIVQCHPEEDGFPLESGSCQGFLLLSSWGFFLLATVAPGLLIRDLNLYPDFCCSSYTNWTEMNWIFSDVQILSLQEISELQIFWILSLELNTAWWQDCVIRAKLRSLENSLGFDNSIQRNLNLQWSSC